MARRDRERASRTPRSPRDGHGYRGPGRLAHWLPVLLVLALLGGGVAAARDGWGPRHLGWRADTPAGPQRPASPVPELPAAAAPEPVAAPLPPGPGLDPAKVRAAVRPGLRDPDLGPHVVARVDSLAGTPGAEPALVAGTDPVVPASTTKVLTAAAALQALGPDAVLTTRVVTDERAREVVLVGGGDPYLASAPPEPGEPAAYPERADVVTLARLTATELLTSDVPVRRVRVRYDAGLFTGPPDNPRWPRDYLPDGVVAPITALSVDGGRDESGWGRVADPALVAAQRFAAALEEAGVRVRRDPRPATAPAQAVQLASVDSAPLDQVVQRMLDISDNEAAEVLAHHVGLATSGVGSFEAGGAGTEQVLAGLGVDTSADELYDGSGLSRDNRISSATLLQVLRLAAAPEHPGLRAVVEGLPVAGFTGSLALRFGEGPPEGPGRIRAKTGTLTGVRALAGITTDLDGNAIVFVLAADRVPVDRSLDAAQALDEVAASLAACACGATPTDSGTGG